MSSSIKTVIWIVVGLVVIAGVWWYVSASNKNNPVATTQTAAMANSMATNQPATGTTLASGTSNQDLNQDLTQIDAQMNGLASDSASVNQSMQAQ